MHLYPMLIRNTTEQFERWDDDDIASSADANRDGHSLMNMSKPVIGEYDSFAADERPPVLPSSGGSMLFESELDKNGGGGDVYANHTRDIYKAADDSMR